MKNFIPIIKDKTNRLLYRNMGKIAVIIPVYNVTTFLEKTIRSVVTQNYPHKEIIVVDDGSKEEAAAEIRRICTLFPDVMLLRQKNAGVAAARHTGLLHASAEFVAYIDADDLFCSGTLAFFASALKKNPDAIAVYGESDYINHLDQKVGK